METTIQISKELLEKLKNMKIHEKESYEDLIWDLVEDRMEFSEETKKAIEDYEKDIKEGNFHKFKSLEEIKKELKLNV
tara:strand:- start:398 stop:631 length:234 start_codon:yes stop_codon:yes gene_type:complete